MQADPKNPRRKPQNTRLKLKYGTLLSSFAFNSNVRHCKEVASNAVNAAVAAARPSVAGAYTRPLLGSS